jgi:type I restriction enzyme, S subunit
MSWPLVLLDTVAERGSGHTPSQKHPEYWNDGIKWVSLADSSALDRRFIFDTAKKISELGLRHSSAVLHPKGTVILSRDAGVGKSAILGDEMAVSQHFIAWRCDGKRLYSEYLYQWLQSQKTEFERIATGSTVKTIGLGHFQRLRLPVPPIEEQRGIARALDTWDTAIQKTEQLIAAKERHYSHELSRLISRGQHPHGHVGTFAEEVSARNRGGNDARVLSVTNSRGFVLPEDQFERRVASADLSNYKVVRRGEYAYNPSRINVGSIARLNGWDDGVLSPMYVAFRLDEAKVDSDYFLHWLNSHEARQRIKNSAQGSVRETVSFSEFAALTTPLPDADKQTAIARYLNALREEIDLLGQSVAALKTQKRGLMQKLLTGQWRLPVHAEANA